MLEVDGRFRGAGERGEVPPPRPDPGRARTTRPKLEELPTLWERTQEKAQRQDEPLLEQLVHVRTRTLRRF